MSRVLARLSRDDLIRILLLLIPVVLIYLALNWFRKTPPAEVRAYLKKTAWIYAIIVLLILMASGRLNMVFAMLGVAIAFLLRLIPAILHYAPQLYRLWLLYVVGKQQYGRPGQQNSERASNDGVMSKAEALQVLGLKPGASKQDVIQAHRKLISKLHPDRGGSDYLAAQINLAKKTLLGS